MFNVGDRVRLCPLAHSKETSEYYGEADVIRVKSKNAITARFVKHGELCLSEGSYELIDCPGDYEPDLEG